jgi:2-polyprenyl-6-methoxyphenol hydroxylase-like FAD-dependent oxidoreductase
MLTNQLPILIIGGGIGGAIAAIALSQKGISSVILEKASNFHEAGAGILLGPNVFRMFDKLDIIDVMNKIAFFPENHIYMQSVTGEELIRMRFNRDYRARFNYPLGTFHREEMLQTLIKECQKSSKIKLITSAKVIGIEEHNDSVVIRTEAGERYEGAILIGADGIYSVVREYLIGDGLPRVSGHIAYRGLIKMANVPPKFHSNNIYHTVKPSAHLIYYTICHGKLFNVIAIFQKKEIQDPENMIGNSEELYQMYEDIRPELKEILAMINTSRRWILSDREPSPEWTKGRIVLIGDAAHPTLPYLTQGAAMAIEDAVVLASLIADCQGDYASAFEKFVKERYERTSHVQLFSRFYGDSKNMLLAQNCNWLEWPYSGIEIVT